jgi:signal transduction histidine kinase/ActR/RegA family two-component response regulator
MYSAVGVYLYKQRVAETEVRLDRALRIAREHALKVFDTNEMALSRVLDTVGSESVESLRGRQSALHTQFRAISERQPQIQSIWLQGADGRPLATDRFFPAPLSLDISDRAYFKWHQTHRGLHISEPGIGRATGTPFFDMSRGRYLTGGEFAGIVSISLSPEYFEVFHSDLAADEPGLAITMLRSDGTILTRWPPLANAPAKLSPNSPVMSRILAGQSDGTAHGVSSVDGRKRLLAFTQIGSYPVYIGTGMDTGEITKRWLEEMGWLAAFGLPPTIGLFFAAAMAFRRTRDVLESAERLNEESRVRRRAEEALLQSQKLEALGRLTGGVAHDFNNALMVISNNLFLLKRLHPQADGPQVESISRAVGSATKLTRQLLAFSRRQALVPEVILLQEKLPGAGDLLGPVVGSKIEVSINVAPSTHPIRVDPAEFELALINLAINSRDAMPAGGQFKVVARNASGDTPQSLQGPLVVVEVSDTGQGIAPELLDKVFEPFFTTKPVGEGTGLGLSQIYGLCQRAHGLATLESTPGKGTTVRLFFPAMVDHDAKLSHAAPELHEDLHREVLLVEDNDDVAAALIPVLQVMGCNVIRRESGSAAKAWLSRQAAVTEPQLPDLVLSDVVMPGEVDGVALAQWIRAEFPGIKVLLMTGYAEQLESIARMGFSILPKPCSPRVLADAIHAMFNEQASEAKEASVSSD